MYTVEPISKNGVLFGESPLWDFRRNQLVLTDCFGKSVNIFDPTTKEIVGKEVVLPEDEGKESTLQFIAICMPYSSSSNKFLVTLSNNRIVEFDWDKGKVTKVLYDWCKDGGKGVDLNDGKCDKKGRLWSGAGIFRDMNSMTSVAGMGNTYCMQPLGDASTDNFLQCLTMDGDYDIPIGLGFNANQTKLYWNDMTRRVTHVYDFEVETAQISNRKTFFDFKNYQELDGSFPDGMCVDINGNVWVACWKGGSVIKIDGETGKMVSKIAVPVTTTTSVGFGGEQYTSLYVTTTSVDLDESPLLGQSHAGKLFEITCPQDNTFKGFEECFINL